MLYLDRVHFQYNYPADFPENAQLQIESVRVKTTGKLQDKPINSFEDQSEAKRLWTLEMASGAAPIIGKVAVMKTWGANRARKMLKDFTLQAAYAVGMTAPAAERFFKSDAWKSLDDSLFLLPDTESEAGPPTPDFHLALLQKITDKKQITLETWARDHGLGRTTFFDWKACRQAGTPLKGKVSDEKAAAIENAIDADAKALGLTAGQPTRTNSD